jgi:hypothetical protein
MKKARLAAGAAQAASEIRIGVDRQGLVEGALVRALRALGCDRLRLSSATWWDGK